MYPWGDLGIQESHHLLARKIQSKRLWCIELMNDEMLKLITSFIVRFVLKNFQNLQNFGNYWGLCPKTTYLLGHHTSLVSGQRHHSLAQKINLHVISACQQKNNFSRNRNNGIPYLMYNICPGIAKNLWSLLLQVKGVPWQVLRAFISPRPMETFLPAFHLVIIKGKATQRPGKKVDKPCSFRQVC
jgi:hypothetical protein